MRRYSLLFLSLFVPLALTACLSTAPEPTLVTVEQTVFANTLHVDLAASTKTASGLYYRDLVQGTGSPYVSGDSVGVYYDGYLDTGVRFDHLLASDSTPAPKPFGFRLGRGSVIAGFEEGVTGMHIGGTRQLIIPPSLAYGSQINYVLVFTVTAASIY